LTHEIATKANAFPSENVKMAIPLVGKLAKKEKVNTQIVLRRTEIY